MIFVFAILDKNGHSWAFWPYLIGIALLMLLSLFILVILILTIVNLRSIYKSEPEKFPPNWKILTLFVGVFMLSIGQQTLKI
jgi:hypothetical protein